MICSNCTFMELKFKYANLLTFEIRRSNCTFMELKWDSLFLLRALDKPFKLYLYGIEIGLQMEEPQVIPVQIVPLWN